MWIYLITQKYNHWILCTYFYIFGGCCVLLRCWYRWFICGDFWYATYFCCYCWNLTNAPRLITNKNTDSSILFWIHTIGLFFSGVNCVFLLLISRFYASFFNRYTIHRVRAALQSGNASQTPLTPTLYASTKIAIEIKINLPPVSSEASLGILIAWK